MQSFEGYFFLFSLSCVLLRVFQVLEVTNEIRLSVTKKGLKLCKRVITLLNHRNLTQNTPQMQQLKFDRKQHLLFWQQVACFCFHFYSSFNSCQGLERIFSNISKNFKILWRSKKKLIRRRYVCCIIFIFLFWTQNF